MFSVSRGWVDAAGKTRTWFVCYPSGQRVAEVTRFGDAKTLALLLSNIHKQDVDLFRVTLADTLCNVR